MRADFSALFNYVRDIPFCASGNPRVATLTELPQLIKIKKGGCTLKHYLLGTLMESLGLHVEYVTTPFLWADLEIEYPSDIKIIVNKMPIQHHLYLCHNGRNIDATWDLPLIGLGLPINYAMGNLNMALAVKPCGESIIHLSIHEREKFRHQLNSRRKHSKTVPYFYGLVQCWFDEVRATYQAQFA